MASTKSPIEKLCRAFRVGPLPKRVDQDAAMHCAAPDPLTDRQIIAYVRHNYTNYEQVCKHVPHGWPEHCEFKQWVNGQVEAALAGRITVQTKRIFHE